MLHDTSQPEGMRQSFLENRRCKVLGYVALHSVLHNMSTSLRARPEKTRGTFEEVGMVYEMRLLQNSSKWH